MKFEKRDTMNRTDLKDYLTDEERKKLVASLHHALVWVGVKEPQELMVDKSQLRLEMEKFHQTDSDMPAEVHSSQGKIELHHLIWRLLNESEITEQERLQIEELIDILQKKERIEEDALKEEMLTTKQAIQLHDEAAGIIRAILDLKDLLKKKEHMSSSEDVTEELIRRKVSEAKRWNQLMYEIKDKKNK
jgi:argonaute-like protein implicated in RNA metabolism and viral defense